MGDYFVILTHRRVVYLNNKYSLKKKKKTVYKMKCMSFYSKYQKKSGVDAFPDSSE